MKNRLKSTFENNKILKKNKINLKFIFIDVDFDNSAEMIKDFIKIKKIEFKTNPIE